MAWFLGAEVPLYEVTYDARIESADAAHEAASPVIGRVVRTDLEVGRWVEEGEALVVLSGLKEKQRLAREGERVREARLRLENLAKVRRVTEQEAAAERSAELQAVERARAGLEEARAGADAAAAEVLRLRELHREGLVSDVELERALALEDQTRAVVASRKAELAGVDIGRMTTDHRWERSLAEIEGRSVELDAAEEVARLGSNEFAAELEDRVIRAPISGWLGQVSTCRPGSVLLEGEVVAVVVPKGLVKVAARFPSTTALGRIRPGQRAFMRLHSRVGRQDRLEAEVVRVGREPDGGRFTVECLLGDKAAGSQEVHHGLVGRLAVEVDRVSPLDLAMTVLGRYRSGANRSAASIRESGERG